jgi:ABC-type sugar transport system permease subunit
MVALAPLLIGSFAFNFNNFNLIFLLTQGGPPVLGADIPVGHTDILISFTFNLASAAGRGNQFGLAAAITMLIFFLLLLISAFSFRFTKRLEDTYGGA